MKQDFERFNPKDIPIGTPFHLDTKGNSMEGLIRPGDVLVAMRTDADDLSIGDIAVFKSHSYENNVTHRLIFKKKRKGKNLFIFKGDNSYYLDDPVATEDIIGRVMAIERGERHIKLDSAKGKAANWLSFLSSMFKFFLKKIGILPIRRIEFKRNLQNFVIKTNDINILNSIYRLYYQLAIKFFTAIFSRFRNVETICLRRQMALGSWQPGLSDIDLSVIVKEISSDREERFLKLFWGLYRTLKKPFPFLGEVEITTKKELENWQAVKGIRSERISHWKKLYGKEIPVVSHPKESPLIPVLTYMNEAMQRFWTLSIQMNSKRVDDLYPYEFRAFFNSIVDVIKYARKANKDDMPDDRRQFISEFTLQCKDKLFARLLREFIEKINSKVLDVSKELLWDIYGHLIRYLDEQARLAYERFFVYKKQNGMITFSTRPLSEAGNINSHDEHEAFWKLNVELYSRENSGAIETILSNSHVFTNHAFVVLKDTLDINGIKKATKNMFKRLKGKVVVVATKNIMDCISHTLSFETPFNYWHNTEQAKVDFGNHPKNYLARPSDDILFALFAISIGQFNLCYRMFPMNRVPTYLLHHSIDNLLRLYLALDKKIITASLKDAIDEYKRQYKNSDLKSVSRLEKYLTLDEAELDRLDKDKLYYENFGLIKQAMSALNDLISQFITGHDIGMGKNFLVKSNEQIRYRTIKCVRPWMWLFFKDNEIRFCCWSNIILGKLNPDIAISHFWNNEIAQHIRQKMLLGETEDICPYSCPVLNSGEDNFANFERYKDSSRMGERMAYASIKNGDVKLNSKPTHLAVIIDHACNLKCKMCFIFDNPNYVISDGFYNIVDEIHDSLRLVYLIGGEPFFSKRSRDFMNDCIKKEYKIEFGFITNLTIFDRDLLSKIAIDSFTVSIDGATKETYEKIRKGANWEKVIENLKALIQFEKEAKKRFPIKVAFVVMTSNFREIPKAVELFEPLGVHLEFPPIIRVPGDSENVFEREEHYDEFMSVISEARKKTSQESVLSSLDVLESILKNKFLFRQVV